MSQNGARSVDDGGSVEAKSMFVPSFLDAVDTVMVEKVVYMSSIPLPIIAEIAIWAF